MTKTMKKKGDAGELSVKPRRTGGVEEPIISDQIKTKRI